MAYGNYTFGFARYGMSSATLRDELSDDPLSRGYSTMTDSEAAADLNSAYRTLKRDSMSGAEIWNNTDATEFNKLPSAAQDKWLGLCGVDSIDPYGPAVDVATDIFSSNSTTLSNLSAARTESITRAQELGLGDVKAYDVAKAREQLGVA